MAPKLAVPTGPAFPRDAVAVTTHQVTYQGPPSFAVGAATLLADSEGVELTSANQPQVIEGSEQVLLALVLEGTPEAVAAAVDAAQADLPAEATITIDQP